MPYYETSDHAIGDIHRVLRGVLPGWPRDVQVLSRIDDPPFHLVLAAYQIDTGPPILDAPGT
ncbi:MAG: hypothetical protein ACREEC_13440, partial [Thermoplasmata archaeon]